MLTSRAFIRVPGSVRTSVPAARRHFVSFRFQVIGMSMLKACLKSVVGKIPPFSRLLADREALQRRLQAWESQPGFAPGHYYSPSPAADEVADAFEKLHRQRPDDIAGIDLQLDRQREIYDVLAASYGEQPFSDVQTADRRFYFANECFEWTDAICLYSLMRHFRPRRIVEIGSGYSSAVMLDVNELFLGGTTELTFIEPYPDRLLRLLKPEDRARTRIIEQKLQAVPDAPWADLQANDMLFIDSSHVSKCGSDVNRIVFEILPSLRPGVLVHVHDIFPGFEYPRPWIEAGRHWNEAYLMRAFLQFNSAFEIVFWAPFAVARWRSEVAEKTPLFLRDSGGSLWLKRTQE
jgi:predicted O-methyltransferase YrrM